MRHLAVMAAILGIFLLTPGAAQSATECGHVPDPSGKFEWRVAAWKTDCPTAVDLGERWVAMKAKTPGRSGMRHRGWLCRQGAQALGWCELGRYWKTQKVVWILTRPDEDVSTWRPRFEPLWRNCGVPKWSRLKHGGKLESWGVKCAKANRVTRLYLKRIQESNPKILGFRCSGGQLTPGVKGRHYLECYRGRRSIRWEGPPRAVFGPGGPFDKPTFSKPVRLKHPVRYCSPTGDFCQGVSGKRGYIIAEFTTFSLRGRYRLCVGPAGRRLRCKSFPFRRIGSGLFQSRVAVKYNFRIRPHRRYAIEWWQGSGLFGKRLRFRTQ